MSRRKDDGVNEVRDDMSDEAHRLLKDHRNIFHQTDPELCKVCRSLRRAVIGGLTV